MTCPPSSWPIGIRLSAVTKRPNQAARPSGPRVSVIAVGHVPVHESLDRLEEERLAEEDAVGLGVGRDEAGLVHPEEEDGQAHDEAGEGARDADVEERLAVRDAAADADEGAERPDHADGTGAGRKKGSVASTP